MGRAQRVTRGKILTMHIGPSTQKFPWGDADTPYLELGGPDNLRLLVDRYYDFIEDDSPELRAMLPRNTVGTRRKLFEFLSGWLGGPPLYTEKRGHPRLRMRHFPFPIGPPEADEWMRCMTAAIEDTVTSTSLRRFLIEKFGPLADHMVNR